jgi:helix-turn-helix protein
MNITTIELSVIDVMPRPDSLTVEVFASGGAELLIGLAAATAGDTTTLRRDSWLPDSLPAGVQRALERLGSRSRELWLHLLGTALETGPVGAAGLVERVAHLDAHELREHVVGVHVPAWRALVGGETLARAARGDAAAARRLLRDERYYGGRARVALEGVLPLTPLQTKRRILAVLRPWADVFAPHERRALGLLEADAEAKRALAGTLEPQALILAATRGYVYEPEPELARIALVPHLAADPWLLLCQHRDTRIICYPMSEPGSGAPAVSHRALALGKALGDEQRLAILARLTAGEASLAELAAAATVARSTAHHHLALLRDAGLVGLRGNARAYRYFLQDDALSQSRNLLAEVLTPRNR